MARAGWGRDSAGSAPSTGSPRTARGGASSPGLAARCGAHRRRALAGDQAGEAEGLHFCGHTYTTDSCPHPLGLPRIDRRGYPLRPRTGARSTTSVARSTSKASPSTRRRALRDPDGRPLPPAPRTKVCDRPRTSTDSKPIDGGWYRCCGGHVRRLATAALPGRRINGDAALGGYCYAGRKVFCVMYFDTKVPC